MNRYNLYNIQVEFTHYLKNKDGISPITAKNYISDLKYFVSWYQSRSNTITNTQEATDLGISEFDVCEYRDYLSNQNTPYKTINRRLSTLRHFFSYCINQGYMKANPAKKVANIVGLASTSFLASHTSLKDTLLSQIIDLKVKNHTDEYIQDIIKKTLEETTPSADDKVSLLEKSKSLLEESNIKVNGISRSNLLVIFNSLIHYYKDLNLKNDLDSTKETSFNLKKYLDRNNTISSQMYTGFLILLLLLGFLSYGLYKNLFKTTTPTLAYPSTLTRGSRTLSFQGRLTDSLGNPINAATNVVFKLHTASSGGSQLYTTGTCSVTPDQDGIFNTIIGQDCGSEIASSVFSENANVYLGVTVGSDAEMTPRQQIANVGYAINAENLQGFPPGTSASTIPYIDNQGDILLGTSTPSIVNTYASQTFVLGSANAVTLQAAGSGDVTLTATESGTIKFLTGGTQAGVVTNGQLWGLGTTGPDAKLDTLATSGEQLRLTYTDGSVYTGFTTNSSGDLTIDPSGDDLTVGGDAILADTFTLQVGGKTGTAYSAFANSGQSPAQGAIAADNDVYIGGDLEVTGNLYAGSLTASNLPWSGLTDPTANLALAHAEYTSAFTWDTAATAATLDAMSLAIKNDAGTDSNTQRLLVLNNNDDGGSTGTTERLLVLDNKDANEAVTTALEILASSTGTITTAIDVSDAEIGTALSIGANDTTATNWNVAGSTGIGTFGGGVFNGNVNMSNNLILNIGDAATDFTSGGGLTLAGTLDANGDVSIADTNIALDGASTTLTATGALTLTPGGAMILGATTQSALVRGTTVGLTSTSAGNDITFTSADDYFFAAGAGSALDYTAAASTVTTGVIDLNIDTSVTGGFSSVNNSLTVNNGAATGDDYFADDITLTNNDADANAFGLRIVGAATANAGANAYETGILIDNQENTAGSMASAIKVTAATNTAITTALDVSDAEIVNALSLGANDVTATNFSITGSTGKITTSGNLNVGGLTGVAYNAFSDSGTTSHSLATDNDVYIEGDAEIDGTLYVDGTLSAATLACTDCLDFTSFADSMTLDAATDINLGTNLFSIDLDSTGDFAIRDVATTFVSFNDDSTTDWILPAGGDVAIDAATTDSTVTSGVFDLNVDAGDAVVTGLNVDFSQSNGATAGRDAIAQALNLTANDADGDVFGLVITGNATANAAAGSYESLLKLTNAEDTASVVTDGILINSTSGTNNDITDAIDVSDSNIVNAINVGANTILGTTGLIDYTNFDVDASGNITAAGDVAVNGGDITSSGDLTINPGGGDVNLGASDNLNLTASSNLTFAGTTTLAETTAANDSGAYFVGAFDEFDNSNSTTVQGVLNDLDAGLTTALAASTIWTDSGTTAYLTATTDEVVIGGSSPLSSAKLSIDGDADQIQLIVQGNATQTSNLATFEDSTGTDLLTISGAGVLSAPYLVDISNSAYGIDPAGTSNFGGYSLKVTGGSLLAADSGNVGIGNSTPVGKLDVNGKVTGKALAIFNETGDQNILTASASGTTVMTLDRSGNLSLEGAINDISGNLVLNDTVDIGSASTGINVTTAGALSDIDGNLVLADTLDLGSASTGLNITTAGLITDIDGNVVIGDAVDLGSASTGINITTAGLITDSDGNVIIGDTVDLGSASTGVNVTTAGVLSDIDAGTLEINDDLQIDGNDILDSGAATRITLGSTTTLTNTTLTLSGTSTLTASSLTALNCSDCIDFDDMEDTLDLDAALTLNQSTNTWTQNFTGTTTDGLTYTANSMTTGNAVVISSTATSFSGGTLLSLDWSPGSLNTNSDDLFKINTSNNGNMSGYYINLLKNSATVLNIDQSGNIVTTGDVAVNGDDLTSDSNLTIAATGYVRIGDSGTPGTASGDDDLYVQDDLEVDGRALFDGNVTFGDSAADTVVSTSKDWTFSSDTTVVLSGGVDGLNFDTNTLSIDATNNRIGLGTAAPDGILHVTGANTGKAMVILNETGDQNIISASASGTTAFAVGRNGDISSGDKNGLSGFGGDDTIIPNGSFEVHNNGVTTGADGWTSVTGTSIVAAATSAHGDYALALQSSAGGTDQWKSNCFPVSVKAYAWSFWAKDNANEVGANVQFTYYGYTSRANCEAESGNLRATFTCDPTTSYAACTGTAITPNAADLWGRVRVTNLSTTTKKFVDGFRFSSNATGTGLDLAETYPAAISDNIQIGEIVDFGTAEKQDGADINNIKRSSKAYDNLAFGVIATNPGIILDDDKSYEKVKVALKGRVPVLVNGENGPIAIGDSITASSTPGVGMKATKKGRIIGRAMTAYAPTNPSEIDQVTIFVESGTYDPETNSVEPASTDIHQQEVFNGSLDTVATDDAKIESFLKATSLSLDGIVQTTKKYVGTIIAGSIRAGNILAKNIVIEGKLVANSILTGSIQSGTVKARYITSSNIKSTAVEADAITTATLSATESITAKNITADNIDSQNVREIQERLQKVAQDHSEVASSAGQLAQEYEGLATDVNGIQQQLADLHSSPLPDTTYYQPSSGTSIESLTISGLANIYDLYVNHTAAIGNIVIQDDQLASISDTLKISAMENIDLMDGNVIIARDGTITTKGQLVAEGGVKTNQLKALNPGDNLSVVLEKGTDTLTGSEKTGQFEVKDSNGLQVASIGADGSAKFKDLSVDTAPGYTSIIAAADNVQTSGINAPAIETNAKSAGSAVVPANANQVVLYNENITDKSLIYITPTSNTYNKSVYVSSKNHCPVGQTTPTPCKKYFVVAIDQPISSDIQFNWWIIQ